MIQSINGAMAILPLLFPDAANDDVRLQAFESLVANRILPREDKNRLRDHIQQLTVLMQLCQVQNVYTDLDHFLQELRHSDQLGTLDDYFVGLAPNNAVQFRELLRQIREHGGIGLTRANDMTEADRDGLRAFRDAYIGGLPNQIPAPMSSSDESSDDGDELRRLD